VREGYLTTQLYLRNGVKISAVREGFPTQEQWGAGKERQIRVVTLPGFDSARWMGEGCAWTRLGSVVQQNGDIKGKQKQLSVMYSR